MQRWRIRVLLFGCAVIQAVFNSVLERALQASVQKVLVRSYGLWRLGKVSGRCLRIVCVAVYHKTLERNGLLFAPGFADQLHMVRSPVVNNGSATFRSPHYSTSSIKQSLMASSLEIPKQQSSCSWEHKQFGVPDLVTYCAVIRRSSSIQR
jgi:hypothetical protein